MNRKDKIRCIKRLYSLHKANCRKRTKDTSLSIELFGDLSQSRCAYCGSKPSNILKYSGLEFAYSGIDRVDSSIGYRRDNVLSCCSFCNSLKGAMATNTWFDFLNSIIHFHGGISPWVDYIDEGRAKKSTWYAGRRA